MEYVDICDKEGNLLGSRTSIKEAHEQGLWHRVVHMWIVNSKRELLLQLRSPKKNEFPNMWDISGAGHVSAGEDYVTAALREIKEELGLEFSEKDLVEIGKARQEIPKDDYIIRDIAAVYIIFGGGEKIMRLQDTEVTAIKWMSYQELRTHINCNDPKFVPHPEEYNLIFSYVDKNFSIH